LAGPRALAAQEPATKSSLVVDEALAKKGKTLWQSRGCTGCHSIGKGVRAGPDVADVHERRDLEWLRKWLTNTTEMLATDSIAMDMLKQYKGTKMPNLKLTAAEADALIHFMAAESAKSKK
jgi:cytochrome c2